MELYANLLIGGNSNRLPRIFIKFAEEIIGMKKVAKFVGWIIGIGISGFLLQPITYFYDTIPWSQGWEWLNRPNISYIAVITGILLSIILFYFYLFILPKPKKESKLEKELKKINSWDIPEEKIRITWDVGIDYNQDPFPYNIKIFCTNHGQLPLLMDYGYCMVEGCQNANKGIFEHAVNQQITSYLLHAREQLKAQGYK